MSTVLLEIGVEEMPAGYMPLALMQLADGARTAFATERIAFEDLRVWGTPRRLVLYLTGVVERQAPAVREVRGPAVQDAFAGNGEPTQAAIGFARSHGISVNELRIRKIDNGEYVVVVFRDEGRPAVELLPEIFTKLITSFTFPHAMRWGSGNFRFVRPIRWIVALMDDQVIPFTIDAVQSGRLTRGHRFLAPGEVEIPSANQYQRIMDENQVIVDQDVRREAIRQQIDAMVQQDNAVLLDDGSLLDETTFRVEYPTAVRGTIDEQFLSLPNEVLWQVLRREQHFFLLNDVNGRLLPAFITVRNGDKSYLGTVREGYEGVARAKLLDARFFFEQDSHQPLGSRVDALRGVIFQENLGTMLDKTKRVETLAGLIAAWLDFAPEDRQFAERAALLAKADLVTAMVMEHPELQGTMGSIYARISGESEPVVVAISEQYQPRTTGGPIPASPIGRVVALADKLDTVVACFAIGISPQDGDDPYGLRAKAEGVTRILIEGRLPLSVSQLIARTLRQIEVNTAQPLDEVQATLHLYFKKRLNYQLIAAGVSKPVITAVLAVAADVPAHAMKLAKFLQQHLQDPALVASAHQASRLANASRDAVDEWYREELLSDPTERAALEAANKLSPALTQSVARQEFDNALGLLEQLNPAINTLLEHPMPDDQHHHQARLALYARFLTLYRLLGDLTKLGI